MLSLSKVYYFYLCARRVCIALLRKNLVLTDINIFSRYVVQISLPRMRDVREVLNFP